MHKRILSISAVSLTCLAKNDLQNDSLFISQTGGFYNFKIATKIILLKKIAMNLIPFGNGCMEITL